MMTRSRAAAEAPVRLRVDADTERGFAMRVLLHSPKDLLAGALASAAIIAIITNALFLQAGRHPSPMFGSVITLPAPGAPAVSPLPRPRPTDAAIRAADTSPPESKAAEPKAVEAKPIEAKPVESKAPESKLAAEARPADPNDQSGQGHHHGSAGGNLCDSRGRLRRSPSPTMTSVRAARAASPRCNGR